MIGIKSPGTIAGSVKGEYGMEKADIKEEVAGAEVTNITM